MMDRMDIPKMLAELKSELEGVEQAILVLERIAVGRGRRRGRPPKWMTGVSPSPTKDKTFTRSAATRARMAAAQRKRGAKRKKAEAGS